MNFRSTIFTVLLSLLAVSTVAADFAKISPSLSEAAVGAEELKTVVVFLEDASGAADLADIAERTDLSRADRIATVLNHLKSRRIAGASTVERFLETYGVDTPESHWIVPAFTVTLPMARIEELSELPEVRFIAENVSLSFDPPVSRMAASAGLAGHSTQLDILGVPSLWQRGLTGKNRLVCSFDTGVESTHPALASKWRGQSASLSSTWFSPVTPNNPPSDPVGHGTHTMGIILGSTASDTIGVAPDAEWITAGVIDQGRAFNTTLSDILNAFQWVLNPDGNTNTTDDVPDVILNSWGVPAGLLQPCDVTFWQAIDAVEAAGIVTIFAAGNEGPNPQTMRSPADRATTPLNSFSVGAVDNNRNVANFSSRGPSRCDNSAIKPEIVAPGVNVYSSTKGGTYVYMSGTSMAAPYIAGLVALCREYNPDASVNQIKTALIAAAKDLGPAGEDNAYGHGLVDGTVLIENLPAPGGYDFVFAGLEYESGTAPLPGTDAGFRVTLTTPGASVETAMAHLTIGDITGVTVLDGDASYLFGFGGSTALNTSPFRLHVDQSVLHGTVVPCSLVIDVGEFAGADTVTFELTLGFNAPGTLADVNTGRLSATISDFGQLGLAEGSIYNLGGKGLAFDGGDNVLFEAGLIVGRNDLQLSSSIRDEHGKFTPSDFVPTVGLSTVTTTGDGAMVQTAQLSDTNADIPIPVSIRQKSIYYPEPGRDGMIILSYRLTNASPERLTHVSFGFLADLDLPGGESVIVDKAAGLVQVQGNDGRLIGIATLKGLNRTRALPNTDDAKVGYTISEQHTLISTDVVWEADPSSDMMALVAGGPYDLEVGDTVEFALAIVIGQTTNELYTNAALAAQYFDIATDVEDEQDLIPSGFELSQNYPNPFNPTTSIAFSLPVAADIALEIYNTLGQRVTTLHHGELPAGSHEIAWDGTDGGGNPVASGVYFYRLTTEQFRQTRKMMLLK